MPSGVSWLRMRRRTIYWVAAAFVLASMSGAAVYLARPTILIGRSTTRSERLVCGDISHEPFNDLLQRFVNTDGNVDYAAWKQSAEAQQQLNNYLSSLSRLDEIRPANRAERLAYWINAYNALTIQGILREYPTSSIQNHVSHTWGYNIWRDLRLIVGDKTYSLGEIEHKVLRPLNEPRVHFAIVCASRGCPRLLNEAYTPTELEEQLQSNTVAFFADPTKCGVDSAKNELHLSPILKWYSADFGTSTSAVLQRIANWLPADAQAVAKSNDVRVVYLDYDWSLNDRLTAAPPIPPPE